MTTTASAAASKTTTTTSARNRHAPRLPRSARLLRRAAAVIGAVGLFVLSGCGPYRATQLGPGNVYKTSKVLLLDRKLDPWILPERIKVLDAILETNPQGFPQLRLEIANNRSKPTSMELRTSFKDPNGLPVHMTSWKPAVVPANATYSYVVVSPEKTATDYQVQIKSLK